MDTNFRLLTPQPYIDVLCIDIRSLLAHIVTDLIPKGQHNPDHTLF